ncbi:hypothetical protein U0070_002365 [Myodes glareolus]|uniref:Uncharacterized protein n=1 Tax=Myodes glareolus TaxID=447135 RepID=A0AAW0IXG1_MYOGA
MIFSCFLVSLLECGKSVTVCMPGVFACDVRFWPGLRKQIPNYMNRQNTHMWRGLGEGC